MIAAEGGDMGVVDAVAARGALGELEATDDEDQSALRLASDEGDPDVVGRLLDIGADPTSAGLFDPDTGEIASRHKCVLHYRVQQITQASFQRAHKALMQHQHRPPS